MDNELLCNFKKCRKGLSSLAWVTSCSHIFCNEDGKREFEKSFVCPACDCPLPQKLDIIKTDLNPSEQYKSMILAGQRPETVLEICSRAIAFWTYQVHQEIMFQDYVSKKAKDRNGQLEKYYENILQKTRNELDSVKQQFDETLRELEESKKRTAELSEKLTERSRQYQKLQQLYESLRRKFVTPSFFDKQSNSEKCLDRTDAHFAMSTASEILCPQSEKEQYKSRSDIFKRMESDFVLRPAPTPTDKKNAPKMPFFQFGNP